MYSTYQDPVEGNVYDYAALPCAAKVSIAYFVHITSSNLHHTQGSDALLECYSAVDYYSTLNEYSWLFIHARMHENVCAVCVRVAMSTVHDVVR